MTTHCRNEWCDALLPDDLEGEACADCDHQQRAEAAYYEWLNRASKPAYTANEIESAYSEPCEYAKRERMLREVE